MGEGERGGSQQQAKKARVWVIRIFSHTHNTVQHLALLKLTQTTNVAADCDGGGGAKGRE